MTHHQHVEMLVQRVPRERHRRVRGRRQHVGFAAETDDVGRVAAAGAFGVIGVNRAPVDRRNRVFDESGFVQRVGVNRDLHVELVGDRQALVDRRRRRAPVLVQLQADRAGANLLAQRLGRRGVALAEKTEVQRKRLDRFVHPPDVPRARRAGRGVGPGRRTGAAADQRREPGVKRVGNLVRRDEVDVRVDAAGGQDVSFAGENLGGRADLETRRDAVHDSGVARPCRSPRCGRRESPTSAL